MARIALIGGHGKVALLAAPKLVAAGHQVTSVFRNPDHREEVAAIMATLVEHQMRQQSTQIMSRPAAALIGTPASGAAGASLATARWVLLALVIVSGLTVIIAMVGLTPVFQSPCY